MYEATAGSMPALRQRKTAQRPSFLSQALQHSSVVVGGTILLVIIVLTLAAPWATHHDPNKVNLEVRLKPIGTEGYFLGTDQFGRDLWSRLLWGGRVSLAVGVISATVAVLLGSVIGMVAGYWGGTIDEALMRIMDIMFAFPYILLAIVIVASLGPGLSHAMIAIVVVGIPFFARVARGAVIEVREKEYVEAARMIGSTDGRILLREILPNILSTILVIYTLNVGWMILEGSALSFLGLGAQPPKAEWGAMLSEGKDLIRIYPHIAILPGLMIFIVVLALNLLGDGLRDLLDPRLRGE